MGKVYEFKNNVVAQVFAKTDEAIEDDKYADLLKRFDVDDDPLSRVSSEDVAQAEIEWARVWRGVELQKSIESIVRTDGKVRAIAELFRSSWRAFRSTP